MASSAVVGIGAAALGLGSVGADLGSALAQVTFGLPNSRGHEREADRIGVELAARAGYDPRAAVTLWQKMAAAGGTGTPEFLSTHPAPESRIADLKIYAEKVMPLYEQARKSAASWDAPVVSRAPASWTGASDGVSKERDIVRNTSASP
jgi:predicted Zn-dependent protease